MFLTLLTLYAAQLSEVMLNVCKKDWNGFSCLKRDDDIAALAQSLPSRA
jgi:hypothetical protein